MRMSGVLVGWENKKVVKSDNTADQTRGRYWWHQNIHVIHLIVIMTIKFPWYSFHHVKSMHVMDSPVLLPFSKSTATKSIRKKEMTRKENSSFGGLGNNWVPPIWDKTQCFEWMLLQGHLVNSHATNSSHISHLLLPSYLFIFRWCSFWKIFFSNFLFIILKYKLIF